MQFLNEFGFSQYSREYFILKALLFYDNLTELESAGFVLMRRKDINGNPKPTIELITEIAIKLTLESGASDAEYIAHRLANWPVSESELNPILSSPLGTYLSFNL